MVNNFLFVLISLFIFLQVESLSKIITVEYCVYICCFLQFYLEEAKGNVDYQGYIFPRRRGQIVSVFSYVHFALHVDETDC